MRIQLYYLTALSTSFLYGSPFELAAEELVAEESVLDNDKWGNSTTLVKSNVRVEPRRRPGSSTLLKSNLRVERRRRPATCHPGPSGIWSRLIILLIGDRNFWTFRWRGGEGVVAGFVGREVEAFGVDEKPDASMVDELVGSILSTKIDGEIMI